MLVLCLPQSIQKHFTSVPFHPLLNRHIEQPSRRREAWLSARYPCIQEDQQQQGANEQRSIKQCSQALNLVLTSLWVLKCLQPHGSHAHTLPSSPSTERASNPANPATHWKPRGLFWRLPEKSIAAINGQPLEGSRACPEQQDRTITGLLIKTRQITLQRRL